MIEVKFTLRYKDNTISHIGGYDKNNNVWILPELQAIQYIKAEKCNFYVVKNNRKTKVIVAIRYGCEYLKTEADNIISDNLLSLPVKKWS